MRPFGLILMNLYCQKVWWSQHASNTQHMKRMLQETTSEGTRKASWKYQGSFCSFLAMAMACTWYGIPSSSKRMLAFQPFGVPAVYNVRPVVEDMLPTLDLVLIAVPGKQDKRPAAGCTQADKHVNLLSVGCRPSSIYSAYSKRGGGCGNDSSANSNLR